MEDEAGEEKRSERKRLQIGPEMDELFLEFADFSTFSRFAGLYKRHEGESRYGQPVWRRIGIARQRARLYLDFDVESESWGFVAELEGDARPGAVKATCKAEDPLPIDKEPAHDAGDMYFASGSAMVASSTGMLSMQRPSFPESLAITMRRRSRTTMETMDEKGTHVSPAILSVKDEEWTALNGKYEVQEGCFIEGMPVYRHADPRSGHHRWLFSAGGRWRLKTTSQRRNCVGAGDSFWWSSYEHSSMLHSGTSLFGTWEAEPIWQTWAIFSHPDTTEGRAEAEKNTTMPVPTHMVHMMPVQPLEPADTAKAEQSSGSQQGSCPCKQQQGGSGNCPCKQQRGSGGDCPCKQQRGSAPSGGACPCKQQPKPSGGRRTVQSGTPGPHPVQVFDSPQHAEAAGWTRNGNEWVRTGVAVSQSGTPAEGIVIPPGVLPPGMQLPPGATATEHVECANGVCRRRVTVNQKVDISPLQSGQLL